MVTLTTASRIYKLDLHNLAKEIYDEIDIKENEINATPLMFRSPYLDKPLVDIYKIDVLNVAEAVGIVLIQNLEMSTMVELSIMRMYFGKQDNVSNYVVYRGTQIASQLREELCGGKYICVAEGPRLLIEVIGRIPYRGINHEA